MTRHYVFADEAGTFDFGGQAMASGAASRYFVLTTVILDDCAIGDQLLRVRRELAVGGVALRAGYFHAAEDEQAVRDVVYRTIQGYDFRIDATILNKGRTYPYLQNNEVRFYKTAWYLHFKHVAPRVVAAGDELLIVAATLGTKKKAAAFREAVDDVAAQVVPVQADFHVAAWSAESDPCLQVADYCCWAIQRRWERDDDRSHVLIRDKIRSEYPAFGGLPGAP